jgi:ribosomal protein S18 acetylase RimI-like enzyme
VKVRPVRREDRRALAAVLARSFYDDPVTSWFYPNDRTRLRNARLFFRIRLKQLGRQEQTHTTEDLAGAALWALPGQWRDEGHEVIHYLPTVPAMLPRLPQVLRAMRLIEDHHPDGPHLYLSILGTDPEQQGRGVGSALIAPGLQLADEEGLSCYLESSKEQNIAFYARHGFVVREEIRLPNGGPPLWLMWRDPR